MTSPSDLDQASLDAEGRGTEPVRIQLSRRKGFNLQEVSRALNGLPALNVARPSKWGNPWRLGQHESGHWFVEGPRLTCCVYCGNQEGAAVKAVQFFRQHVSEGHLPSLPPAGHNLACWCALDAPCHADVLLRLANVRCEALLPDPPRTSLASRS